LPVIPPQEDEIVARLCYEFDGKVWAAIVTRSEESDGGWQLWYQRGTRWQRSGVFAHGKALVKFLREETETKFKWAKPTVDTLDSIVGKSPWSVIPTCWKQGEPLKDECSKCPYFIDCFPDMPVAEFKEEEAEDAFLKRLHSKIQKEWGTDAEPE